MRASPVPSSGNLLTIACVASLLAVLPAARAANFTWTGASTTLGWGNSTNWGGVTPTFDNTADLLFPTSSVTNTNSFIGGNRTVRSIQFGEDVDTAMGVNFQDFNGGTSRSLTFDTDAVGGNVTISVAVGATGNITFGNATSTSGSIGNPILADNLVVDHKGSGLLLFNRPFQAAAFGITKTGSGTLQTNNNNLLTGALNLNEGRFIANTFGTGGLDLANFTSVNLNGGTLQINSNSNNKTYSTATNPFNVNSPSTLAYFNGSTTTSYNANISGSAAFGIGANLTVQNISSNASLSNLLTISRNATGSGNVIVETYNNLAGVGDNPALGRASLSGDNTGWSGDFIIRQGTGGFGGNVTLSSAGSGEIVIGETGNSFGAGLQFHSFGFVAIDMFVNKNITVTSGGFRTIRATSDNTYQLNGDIALQGDLAVVNANFFNTHNIIINGNVSGAGGLSIAESGTLVGEAFTRLTGNNTYLGDTTVGTNATLSVISPSGNGIGDSSAVSLTDSGSRIAFGSNETIGSLATTGAYGTVAVDTGFTLTTGGTNASTVFSGNLTGNGTLLKAGNGVMTLNGTTTIINTVVESGTLALGSAAVMSGTNVAVNTGAIIDSSALPGGLFIASGNRIAGDGLVNGDLSLSAGAQFVFSLTSTLEVNGTVALDDSFSISSLVNADGSAVDWTAVDGGVYTLVGATLSSFSNIANFGPANAADVGGGKLAYFQDGSLQLVVIPEPAVWSLFVLGLLGVRLLRRKPNRI